MVVDGIDSMVEDGTKKKKNQRHPGRFISQTHNLLPLKNAIFKFKADSLLAKTWTPQLLSKKHRI